MNSSYWIHLVLYSFLYIRLVREEISQMCVLYTVSDRTPYLNWQAIICPTGPRTVRFSLKRPVENC